MKKLFFLFVLIILVGHTSFSQKYAAAVLDDEFWGYIDETGSFILQPMYNMAKDYNSGVGLIKNLDEWYYVNRNGSIINNTGNYIARYNFSEGFARVEQNNLWGFINTKGEIVIQPKFTAVRDFKNDIAAVRLEDKWGYIDKSGNYFVNPKFYGAKDFNDGGAMVKDKTGWVYLNATKSTFPSNREYEIRKEFSNEMAAVLKDKLWGYINANGDMLIQAQFDDADKFIDGFAPVKIDKFWGYINKKGEFLVPTIFEVAKEFNEGMALVRDHGIYFYINTSGDEIGRNSNYIVKYNFHDGLARIIQNGKWGFIDKEGKIIIPAIYNKVEDFSNGFAAVLISGKWGFINKNGEIAVDPKYRKVGDFKKL
jgi:hypothetical protein